MARFLHTRKARTKYSGFVRFSPMKTFVHSAMLAVLLSGSAIAADAPESHYDRSKARKLTSEEARLFGPQAGKYNYDARMIRAAEIAAQRARKHSTNYRWRYDKTALRKAGAVKSYPDTTYAKNAATELPHDYGFKKIAVQSPYAAPLGSVLVYGGRDAGHVEIRTRNGFVSDYFSPTPRANRPFIGAFVLPRT